MMKPNIRNYVWAGGILVGTFAGVGLLVIGIGYFIKFILADPPEDTRTPPQQVAESASLPPPSTARDEPPRVRIRGDAGAGENGPQVPDFAETVARRELWPAEITLTSRQQIPLFQGDHMVGEQVIESGRTLELREIRADGILITRDRGRRILVAVEDTDLQLRIQGDEAARQPVWAAVERPGTLWEQAKRVLRQHAEQSFDQAFREWALENNWVLEIDFAPGRITAVADPRAAANGDRERLRKLAGYLAQSYLVKGEQAGRGESFVECQLLDPKSYEPVMRMSYSLSSAEQR